MRLKTVFLLFPSLLWLLAASVTQAQSNADSISNAESTELAVKERDAQELLELRGRLRDIESMLMAQKDRENELLRDLNRMILASQEKPEDTAAEEAKMEIQGVEQRFQEESAALEAKIQQLEIALAAGQERDLQMGQQMNQTILITVSTVAGIGLLVFLVTVYLQYRLISRPIQPIYMSPQPLALEGGGDESANPAKQTTSAEEKTGLVENSKVKDTNEKFVSAVEQLEERIRHMEAGLSRADEVLGSTHSATEAASANSGVNASEEEIVEEVVLEGSHAEAPDPIIPEALDNEAEDFSKVPDKMDVNVLEEEGKRFLQKEEWGTAFRYFDRLVQLDDQRVDNWVNRGRALEMLQREEEAIESYDHAIEVNSDLPSPFLYKAALLSRLERFEEAQKFYNAALSKVPVQKTEEATVVS